MVDYFVAQAPPGVCLEDAGKGVTIQAFEVTSPAAPSASLVEQLKALLATGSVQQLRAFLKDTYDSLCDLNQFNLILLSANVIADDKFEVAMDIILKSLNDSPIVRLVDTKGDFCVVRFDK